LTADRDHASSIGQRTRGVRAPPDRLPPPPEQLGRNNSRLPRYRRYVRVRLQ
jgi:hypothetical protein